jgi:hypothetical protein
MSERLIAPIEAPGMPGTSNIGMRAEAAEAISISISLSSSSLRAACAEAVARRRARGRSDQRVEHALLGGELGLAWTSLRFALAHGRDRDLDQIAHDLLDVAADIADLGELGRLDLEERRVRRAWPAAARSRSCRQPVGPIIRMFLGAPPRADRPASCCRRQRLRSAIATARLASCWPTMKRSSSDTISRGENDVIKQVPGS